MSSTPLGVVGKTCTGRNQAANYNVFLKTPQGIAGAADSRFGQYAGRFLERGRRNERLGRQRRLGDAQKDRLVLRPALVARGGPAVLFHEAGAVDLLAAQIARVAGFAHFDLAQHLANDRFDVLVVDLHALQPVDVLDFLDQIRRQRLDAEQTQDVMRIGLAVDDCFALLHVLAFEHDHVAPLRNQLLVLVAVHVADDQALLALGVLAEADHARALGEDRRLLGLARFEKIRDARQTARDVARLRRFLRNTRDDVADADLGAVLERHDRTRGQEVLRRNVRAREAKLAALLVD